MKGLTMLIIGIIIVVIILLILGLYGPVQCWIGQWSNIQQGNSRIILDCLRVSIFYAPFSECGSTTNPC